MKKLLVLMMVVGLASLVNAAPIFTAVGTNPYEITITYMDPVGSTACDVYIDYTPLLAQGVNPNSAVLTGIGAPVAALNILTLAADGFNAYSLGLGTTGSFTSGTILARLDLNGAAANVGSTPVSLGLYNGDGEGVGQVVVLIPEPATIAVLSLGGLLLRRKK